MKKAKKFLLNLLAFASVSAFALGMVACGDDSTGDNTKPVEKTEIEQVYDSYVEYATEQGQAPLDYEVWLATIQGATGAKGDKGDKGDKGVGIENVQVDENGMMIITLTDGTVLPAIELPTGEPIEKGATRNLHYQRISGKDEYRVIGLGLASEQDIVISPTYNGLPVTEIGESAFENETYITSVEIPDSVKTIGSVAFRGCEKLTSITIPNSVKIIEGAAFGTESGECFNLTSVYYEGDIASWCEISFDWMANPLFNGADLYINNEKVVDLVIPDGVEAINGYAFNGANFESVTIGNSVTAIGNYAFSSCKRLTEVYNKSALEITVGSEDNGYVGYYATHVVTEENQRGTFAKDENGYIIYTNGNDKVLVGYTGKETDLTLPSDITQIKSYAFYECSNLTSVAIGNSVTTIGDYAFAMSWNSGSNLTSVTIGNSVTTIGMRAFQQCFLTSAVFEDTSTWYRTSNYENWINKINGVQVDVSDAGTAGDLLYDGYDYYYYWYKL